MALIKDPRLLSVERVFNRNFSNDISYMNLLHEASVVDKRASEIFLRWKTRALQSVKSSSYVTYKSNSH